MYLGRMPELWFHPGKKSPGDRPRAIGSLLLVRGYTSLSNCRMIASMSASVMGTGLPLILEP